MPKVKNRIELYHLGREDALNGFEHRIGRAWWPNSSQYKRGIIDGLKILKGRGDENKLWLSYHRSPRSVQKRWDKVGGEPSGESSNTLMYTGARQEKYTLGYRIKTFFKHLFGVK